MWPASQISVFLLGLAVAGVAFAPPAISQTTAEDLRVGVELVLAVDVSRSMNADEQIIQRRGYAQALRSVEVQNAIFDGGWGRVAVTYVEWAGAASQYVLIPWTLIDTQVAAEAFATRIEAERQTRASRTSISGALDFSATLFEDNGYAGLRRVIDVSGDGPNNAGGPVLAARDAALARGIIINGLPLMTNDGANADSPGNWGSIPDLDRYYVDCVIGGPGSFAIPVTDWAQFAAAVRRKLVLELAATPAPEVLTPVQATAPVDCLIGEKLRELREMQ